MPEEEVENLFQAFLRLGCKKFSISTGSEEMDALFGPYGIQQGRINEIVSDGRCGERELVIELIVNFLTNKLKEDEKVIIFDFKTYSNIEGLKECFSSLNERDFNNKILNRIMINTVRTIEDLSKSLQHLSAFSSHYGHTFIIINNIDGIIGNQNVKFENGDTKFGNFVNVLRKVTTEEKVALVTVNKLNTFNGKSTPKLGHKWTNDISNRIELGIDFHFKPPHPKSFYARRWLPKPDDLVYRNYAELVRFRIKDNRIQYYHL